MRKKIDWNIEWTTDEYAAQMAWCAENKIDPYRTLAEALAFFDPERKTLTFDEIVVDDNGHRVPDPASSEGNSLRQSRTVVLKNTDFPPHWKIED